jgi:eukaryotic-like serine/threonine-protein kinase
VDVFDMGVLADGRPFVVLELLEGRDLRAELSRMGVLSIPAALEIVAQVLRGLSALHEAGIVHCDIKLENLFLCADGHVEVLDLGAAERMGEECGERAPSLGTPRTMAPEQYEGKLVDGRADLYAVGIVLYELLTGRGPFDDVSGFDALRFAHCHRPPPRPSHSSPQFVPPEVDALVMRALAKSPNDRFLSATAMAMAIAALRSASCTLVLPECAVLQTRASPPPLTSVTVPSRWTIQGAWSSSALLLKRIVSPAWLLVIAIFALIIASVALGVAVGQRLPCAAALARVR